MTETGGFYTKGREIVKNDRLKYIGIGVTCWSTKWTSQDEALQIPNRKVSWDKLRDFCVICYENCMSPTKTCPSECLCQWFNWI